MIGSFEAIISSELLHIPQHLGWIRKRYLGARKFNDERTARKDRRVLRQSHDDVRVVLALRGHHIESYR
jgi:hypothetical protein